MRKRVSRLSIITVGPTVPWDSNPGHKRADVSAKQKSSPGMNGVRIPGYEFVPAMRWIAAHAHCEHCESIHAAAARARQRTESAAPVDLIVLQCTRRGQFSASDIEPLKATTRGTRIIALLGSWCEGELRHPYDQLPGAIHVPWHRWEAWAHVHIPLAAAAQRHEARRLLSASATAEELAKVWSRQPLARRAGRVVIDAVDRDSAAAIAEMLLPAGYTTAWCPREKSPSVRGAVAVVCDAASINEPLITRIVQVTSHFAPSPVLVLVNFPRSDEIAAALAAGAFGLLKKPFTMGEILGQLELALDAASAAGKSKDIPPRKASA
jgi:hypothetical protein